MGFSTGKWEGDILVVTTTHIKQEWIRRNGVPNSDRSTMIEHFIRHGNILTHMVQWTDPVNLTEPLLRSEEFVLQERTAGNWLWPCEYVDEVADRPRGEVPHYLPGKSPYAGDFAWRYGVPVEAANGGAETMYPEYRDKLRTLPQAHQAGAPVAPQDPDIHEQAVHRSSPLRGRRLCWRRRARADAGPRSARPPTGAPAATSTPSTSRATCTWWSARAATSRCRPAPTASCSWTPGWPRTPRSCSARCARSCRDGPIRWIVNTHAHEDHTGGNEVIGKAGSTTNGNPTPIVAHENVLTRMSLPGGGQTARPDGGLADQLVREGHEGLLLQRRAGDGLPRAARPTPTATRWCCSGGRTW